MRICRVLRLACFFLLSMLDTLRCRMAAKVVNCEVRHGFKKAHGDQEDSKNVGNGFLFGPLKRKKRDRKVSEDEREAGPARLSRKELIRKHVAI